MSRHFAPVVHLLARQNRLLRKTQLENARLVRDVAVAKARAEDAVADMLDARAEARALKGELDFILAAREHEDGAWLLGEGPP